MVGFRACATQCPSLRQEARKACTGQPPREERTAEHTGLCSPPNKAESAELDVRRLPRRCGADLYVCWRFTLNAKRHRGLCRFRARHLLPLGCPHVRSHQPGGNTTLLPGVPPSRIGSTLNVLFTTGLFLVPLPLIPQSAHRIARTPGTVATPHKRAPLQFAISLLCRMPLALHEWIQAGLAGGLS